MIIIIRIFARLLSSTSWYGEYNWGETWPICTRWKTLQKTMTY